MKPVKAILFEPVGCLAEFPAEPFLEIAARRFGGTENTNRSGSHAYWNLLNLMEAAGLAEIGEVRDLEMKAVAEASVFEDVLPALSELKAMPVELLLVSSLSRPAVSRFLKQSGMENSFSAVWTRDGAGGIKTAPLLRAIGAASLLAEHAMYLTDTSEGLKVAKHVKVQAILMINDPDEAQRLALEKPAGGIVSLQELPDFLRLLSAQNT